jgi:hypothetical protein
MDAMKFATDMCDGKAFSEGAHIKICHCSVMVAYWQVLEEVDRNHPFVV